MTDAPNPKHKSTWIVALVFVFGAMFTFTVVGTARYWFVAQPVMIEQKLAEKYPHGIPE